MTWFSRNKTTDLTNESIQLFKQEILEVMNLLNNSGQRGHATMVKEVLDSLESGDISDFISKVNSANLWGGSGSVWEIDYSYDMELRNEYKDCLLALLRHMDRERIMEKGAKQIFNLLKRV